MLDRLEDTSANNWDFPGIESLADWAQQLNTISSATLANLCLLLLDSDGRLARLTATSRAAISQATPTRQSGQASSPSTFKTPEPVAITSQRSIRPRRKPASEVPANIQPVARPTVQRFVNAVRVRTFLSFSRFGVGELIQISATVVSKATRFASRRTTRFAVPTANRRDRSVSSKGNPPLSTGLALFELRKRRAIRRRKRKKRKKKRKRKKKSRKRKKKSRKNQLEKVKRARP